MDKFRTIIKDYFSLSEKESNGVLVMIVFIVLLLITPTAYNYYLEHTSSSEPPLISSIEMQHELAREFYTDEKESNLFTFNPNDAPSDKLLKLGISNYLVERIQKYKKAGGIFRTKTDLKKIYGFPEELYLKLSNYIALPDSSSSQDFYYANSPRKQNIEKKQAQFDINTAEKDALIAINGIGPVLADRILKFRNAMGGFVNSDQLYEVYGLDSTVASQLIKSSFIQKNFKPVTIAINSADLETLDKHPYINKYMAGKIIRYREKQGVIKTSDDLINSKAFTNNQLQKILPYISF